MANGVGASVGSGVAAGAGTGAAIGAAFGGVGAPIGAVVGGIVGGVGGYMTGKKKADLQDEKENLVKKREGELNSWFNTEYNKNILDSDYGKALTTQIENRVKDSSKQLASTSAITGASDEAKQAAKANIERNIADTYTNVAARGQERKDNIRRQYLTGQAGYDAAKMDLIGQEQQSLDNAMKNFSTAGDNMSNAYSMGAFQKNGGVSNWFNKQIFNPSNIGGFDNNSAQIADNTDKRNA